MKKRTPFSLLVLPPFLLLPALLLPAVASDDDGEEVELDESEVFVEFNSTDMDFGIQFFWDGEPWARMKVESPEAGTVLNVKVQRNLAEQGLTEGFFESAEPPTSVLNMQQFLERFPAGEYEFEGETLEGHDLEGETLFTHVLPAPAGNFYPPDESEVSAAAPLTVSFDAVTRDLEGNPLEPELYEVVLETEGEILRVMSLVLEGSVANPAVTVPPEFLQAGREYKFEVIVQEGSGNRTISETTFCTL